MDQLKSFMNELSTLIAVGGAIWIGFALIVFGFGWDENDGHGLRKSLKMALGGAAILAGGLVIKKAVGG